MPFLALWFAFVTWSNIRKTYPLPLCLCICKFGCIAMLFEHGLLLRRVPFRLLLIQQHHPPWTFYNSDRGQLPTVSIFLLYLFSKTMIALG